MPVKSKPKLSYIKETIYRVNYADLESFISKVYRLKGWSFVTDHECANDSDHTFDVTGKDVDEERLGQFIKSKGDELYMTHELLNDCCVKGLIEPGQYLIAVCW